MLLFVLELQIFHKRKLGFVKVSEQNHIKLQAFLWQEGCFYLWHFVVLLSACVCMLHGGHQGIIKLKSEQDSKQCWLPIKLAS